MTPAHDMHRKVEPGKPDIYTFLDCPNHGSLTHACLKRFDCKTGLVLATYLQYCYEVRAKELCPRGYA